MPSVTERAPVILIDSEDSEKEIRRRVDDFQMLGDVVAQVIRRITIAKAVLPCD